MTEDKFSVDDILNELELKKAKDTSAGPRSTMQHVDDMIEQILVDKKNAQLKAEKTQLSLKEREVLEKEIRSQTRSITKQYERSIKETTRQLKKLEREEKAIEHEIDPTDSNRELFEIEQEYLNRNTQTLKLASIAKSQTLKLNVPVQEIDDSEQKKQKRDMLKQSAHIEIIKREMMDITSHFGTYKEEVAEEKPKPSVVPTGFKEYRKNRSKKIDGFVLTPEQAPIIPSIETQQEDVLLSTKDEPEEKIISEENTATKTQDLPTENIIADEEEKEEASQFEEFEFTAPEQAEAVYKRLLHEKRIAGVNVVGMGILSLIAIIMSFVFAKDNGLYLMGSIVVKPIVYAVGNLILLVIAMIFSRSCFSNMVDAIINKSPSKDILYSITIIITFVVNVAVVFAPANLTNANIHIYTPVVIVSLFFCQLAKKYQMSQIYENFCYLADDDSEKYTLSKLQEFTTSVDMTKGVIEEEPVLVKNVKTKFFDNFITNSTVDDENDYRLARIALFALPVAVVAGAGVYFMSRNLYQTMTVVAGIMAISTTLMGAMTVAFPLKDTSKIIEHYGEMTPCVGAIDEMCDVNSLLIDAYDLFPADTVVLHGIKTFSGKRIDDAILDAASVVCQSKSILSNVFLNIIAQNSSLLKKVDTIVYEDLMGISAWVDNKRVLIGNRNLMINHSIAVPSKAYEEKYNELSQEVVYLSTEGELSAAFVVQLTTTKEIFDMVNLLERNEVKAIIKTSDAILTVEQLSKLFHIETSSIKILPSRLHKAFAEETQTQENAEILLGNNGSLMGAIISTVATKKLSFCVKFGTVLNLIQIVLGIIMLCIMFLFGKISMVTNMFVLIYMAVFGLFYWICQKNVHL